MSSKRQARTIIPHACRRKEVIPNPVKDGLPERHTGARDCRIVSFCRLEPQKNLPLLIGAFEKFLQSHPQYALFIYGKGEEKQRLTELVREKNLAESVHFLDFQSDLHQQIVDSAMFVLPSNYEGLSNSMLEAMSIGLPCICTDCPIGGAQMMIQSGENGLLVPVGDEEAMLAAMTRIADDPAFAERLSANASKVRDELSASHILSRWEKLLG
ncbi:MAG: glycosyltransferase [Oscillospiraceae bacterium]